MSSELEPAKLTAEELLKRKKEVRKSVLLRGLLLGGLAAAWWVLFVPESIIAGDLKYVLGVVVGLLATGAYLFQLRDVLMAPARD